MNQAFNPVWAPHDFGVTLLAMARMSLDLQETMRPRCKSDGTLVTDADTGLEAMFERYLARVEPNSKILGEETVQSRSRQYVREALDGRTWVVDPIDGTLLYCMRMPGWGISLGLMEDGVLSHGLVAFPGRVAGMSFIELVYSHEDEVWTSSAALGTDDVQVLTDLASSARRLEVLEPVEGFPGALSISQRVAKNSLYRGPQPVLSTGSCVSSFRYLMHGAVHGYMIRMRLWDIAASWPLALRLGCSGELVGGLRFGARIDNEAWCLDPDSPAFLELRDHALFYRPGVDPGEIWKHSTWPGKW